jgi:D-galactarolactone cycloisomerase
MSKLMRITKLEAIPISFPVPENKSVRLGIGKSVKRDSVLVRVETDDGVVGWGEAHHGRAPGAIARLIDTTMRELIINHDALDINGIWSKVYKMQISSHGMGAASVLALSGIDLALWDIRSQFMQQPLYRLLGGAPRKIKAYAGGIALGWQDINSLADEALEHIANGYRALKLRVGDTAEKDIARVQAVRKAVGPDIDILVDANTNYTLQDIRKVMPSFDEAGVSWLEEPFPPQDRKAYELARTLGRVPFAAGENHYTRYEFATLLDDGNVQFIQPDLSKAGGITESLRIAAMASAYKLTINPHTSATAINMGNTIHFLSAIDNPGYFEGDVTSLNPFRDEMMDKLAYQLDKDGCVTPYDGIGIGMKINLGFVKDHPLIDGPCYV